MNIAWYLTAPGAALIWGIHYPLIDFALRQVSVFTVLLVSLFVPGQSVAADAALEIFDGHIHYSSDVWGKLPELAAEARSWLRQLPEGVARNIAHGNAARLFPLEEQTSNGVRSGIPAIHNLRTAWRVFE